MDELLTISEVATRLRRSERTILRLIEQGKLENRRVGHIHYVKPEWVEAYFMALPRGTRRRGRKT